MVLEGETVRYRALAATLHWLSAGAILVMIPLGFAAAYASGPAQAAALLRLHLPLGVTVLGLTLVRVAWWLVDVRPDALPGQSRWLARLAGGSHVLLYILIVLLCVSGIGLVVLSHAVPAIFTAGAVRLPDFSTFPPMAVHVAGALGLIGLLVLHLGAVVYHQLYRRDHILARMRVGRPMRAA